MIPPDRDLVHDRQPTPLRTQRSRIRAGLGGADRKLRKRITMNPPAEFVAFAAAMDPQPERVNNPIVIGQGGQAVMVPPADQPPVGSSDTTLAATNGDPASQTAPQSPTGAMDTPGMTTAEGTGVATPVATTPAVQATTPPGNVILTTATAGSTTALSDTVPSPTDTSWASSAVTSGESVSDPATPTWAAVSTDQTPPAATVTTTATGSSSSSPSTTSASASISASVSALGADNTVHPFTRSAPFIFLVVLGSLVLIAVLATSLSWIFRRPCFPCWDSHPDDDDDGLSDLVTSFHSHTPSRSSTIRRSAYDDDPESDLHRRASAFATDPTQSPFLHSYSMGPNMSGLWGVPPTTLTGAKGTGNAAPSIQVPAPAHLYGGGGPLEIRNAVPGEMDHVGLASIADAEYMHQPREMLAGRSPSPRFLGLDGQGLEVPWSRQTSASELIGLGIETSANSVLTSPYISAPDARDYLGHPHPDFPSPLATDEAHSMRSMNYHTIQSDAGSPPPQRAGTWASNLRNTLFAAIAGNKAAADEERDRYTRTILPLHRNSTRRKPAFPVIEEKDDVGSLQEKGHIGHSESDAAAIGSVFLAHSASASSDGSVIEPMMHGQTGRKMPLGGGAAERYKRYYAKSTSSGASSESGWTVDDRVPSRLAGGERAKGVKVG